MLSSNMENGLTFDVVNYLAIKLSLSALFPVMY